MTRRLTNDQLRLNQQFAVAPHFSLIAQYFEQFTSDLVSHIPFKLFDMGKYAEFLHDGSRIVEADDRNVFGREVPLACHLIDLDAQSSV